MIAAGPAKFSPNSNPTLSTQTTLAGPLFFCPPPGPPDRTPRSSQERPPEPSSAAKSFPSLDLSPLEPSGGPGERAHPLEDLAEAPGALGRRALDRRASCRPSGQGG